MKIDNNYEQYLASQGISLDLNECLSYLWDLAENIYSMAFNANCYFHIMSTLMQQWNKYEEVLRVSGAFIHFTLNSLITSSIVDVCKIYDSNVNSKTIYSLDKEVKNNFENLPTSYSRHFDNLYKNIYNQEERENIINQLKESYIKRSRERLVELNGRLIEIEFIAKNIKKQRNKLYAHNDCLYNEQESNLILQYPITHSNISQLIDFALDYSITVIALITGLNRPKIPVNINDFEGLMQYILEGYEVIQNKLKN